ncbi:MAG: cell wall hydrolase [Lachnospiraceae bacterium]|nr:cell wall hydrolase [Lachnospiraceae bacterium]
MKTKKIVAMLLMCAVLLSNMSFMAKAEESSAENAKDATTETTETIDSTENTTAANATTVKSKTTAKNNNAVKKKMKKGNVVTYSKQELRYMATIIYCEAGNQSYAGKLAVGIVVKNRMESKKFPNTIKGVLYQRYQFTPTRNGALNRALRTYDKNGFKTKEYSSCLKAAKEALSGVKTVKVGGKTRNMKGYYFFSRYVSGCRLKIGAHMFK